MKNRILTIPNIISMVRLLLVPAFVILYFISFPNHEFYALSVLVVSGISDVLDGAIARKFGMISDAGKLLDPLADKVTQVAVAVCLVSSDLRVLPLVIIVFLKELIMILGTLCLFSQGYKPSESKWWGKLTTVILYAVMGVFLLGECLSYSIPDGYALALVTIAAVCLIFSLLSYYGVFQAIVKGRYNPDRDDRQNAGERELSQDNEEPTKP